MGVLGLGVGGVTVPVLPELVEAVQVEVYKIPLAVSNSEDEEREVNEKATLAKICDKGSTLYNVSYALGCAVAPIIGGALDDALGFRTTSDIMAFLACGLAVFYYFAGILCIKKTKIDELDLNAEVEEIPLESDLLKERLTH